MLAKDVHSERKKELTDLRSGRLKRSKILRRATSVDCPTNTPSSFGTRDALLHRAPISMAFFKAGATNAV